MRRRLPSKGYMMNRESRSFFRIICLEAAPFFINVNPPLIVVAKYYNIVLVAYAIVLVVLFFSD